MSEQYRNTKGIFMKIIECLSFTLCDAHTTWVRYIHTQRVIAQSKFIKTVVVVVRSGW